MQILKNAAWTFLDTAAISFSRILLAVILSWVFGAAGYGIFQLSITTISLMASLAVVGLSIANNFLAGRFQEKLASILGNSVTFSLAAGTAIGLITFIGMLLLEHSVFAEVPRSFWGWILVSIPLQTLNMALSGILFGRNLFRTKFLGTSIQFGFLALGVGVAAAAKWLSLSLLLPFWVLCLIWADAYWLFTLLKMTAWTIRLDRKLLKEQLTYGGYAFLYNMAHLLNFRLDLLLVAYFLDARNVGWYSLASSITEALLYLPKSFGVAILTKTAAESSRTETSSYKLAYKGVNLSIVLLSILVAAAAPFVIPLVFSSNFIPVVKPLWLLIPGTIAMALGILASFHLFGLGNARLPSQAALAAMVATVVLDIILIPVLGIQGAALASSISYTLFMWFAVRGIIKALGTSVRELMVPTLEDAKTLIRIGLRGLKHVRP
jgi:O-antigen/teichoic acid export membrane protein